MVSSSDQRPSAQVVEADPPEVPEKPEVQEKKAQEKPASPKAKLRQAMKDGAAVQGKVVAIVRGGYEVDVDGIVALCPFSQIDLGRLSDQLSHLHKVYTFQVTAYRQRGKRVVLSRRRLLEKEVQRAEREARSRIKPGSVHQGQITSVTDFGAFVEFSGVQGMVHVSEITHERINRPADRLKVGDQVQVKVLKAERRKGRISLSMKALEEDPWSVLAARLKPNEIVRGKLLRTTEFGAFVEVGPGVDGLIHKSEVPAEGWEALAEQAKASTPILVQVLKVDAAKRRVALAPAPEGMKEGERAKVQQLRPGRVVEGEVQKVDKSGVQVRIGPGQVGLIPPNETGTPRNADLEKAFPVGRQVSALVMGADRGERRVRLSIRKAERQEERRQLDDYKKSAASGAGSFATLGDFFRKD